MKTRLSMFAVAALLIAACGGEDATTQTTAAAPTTTAAPATTEAPTTTTAAPTTTAPPATTAAETTTEPDAGEQSLAVASSDLGDIVTDAEGFTLYVFQPDGQGDSTCYDTCEDNWPPLVGDVSAGDGIDAALIGSSERTDGSVQVTYDGWPLYYFAADAEPGDTNGQLVGDVWFVIGPDGTPIREG